MLKTLPSSQSTTTNHFWGEDSGKDFLAEWFVFTVMLDKGDRQDSGDASREGCCQLKKKKIADPSELMMCLILQLQVDQLVEARVTARPRRLTTE